jgi:hypothetical protein
MMKVLPCPLKTANERDPIVLKEAIDGKRDWRHIFEFLVGVEDAWPA